MRNRFYLPSALRAGEQAELTGDELHHASRVTRIREGEEVELFDGKGTIAFATAKSVAKDRATFLIDSILATSRESSFLIHLAMAVIQLEKFELVLQKATELGAQSLTPLMTDRGEVRAERFKGKKDRWEKIILEAVKQSGRSVIPLLQEPKTFDEVIGQGSCILFDADEPESKRPLESPVTLLIGPEGGWSPGELGRARESHCAVRRMGPRRLRAETAALAALAVIGAEAGDLK